PQSSASFSKQVQEFDSVREFFTSATIVSAVDLPFTLIFLALISYLGGWMVLIPIALMLFLLLSSWFIKGKLSEAIDESSKLATQRQAHLLENLNLLQQIKHHNAEAKSQRQWEAIINNMAEWQVRSKFLSNSMSHILMSVQQLSSVLLVIAGVYQIFAGNLSMGGLIAIVMISGRAANSINQLTMLILRYHQCKSAITSLESTMALPQEDNQKAQLSGEFEGRVQIQGLCFQYPDTEQKVLDGISLSIKAGEKVALVGAAGSGKSTLLALLARQYQVAQGQLQYDQIDAAMWPVARLRKRIGFMPQMPLLHFGSIIDNIVMGLNEVSKEQLSDAIYASGVVTFIQQLPKGLETQVGELGRNLSGGQRQAILLARTLINQPTMLVLDEPTSFMDQRMKQHVIKQLQQLKATIVIASHDPALLSICAVHYPLQQGKLLDKVVNNTAARRATVTIKDQDGKVVKPGQSIDIKAGRDE
ncbi:MAG: ATP-binding cassette domain-containing protein, partial [Pseudomonadales bacterium]|nr:ATP-binding cassette domain-containing protein [Pseudomonadales bacterium]